MLPSVKAHEWVVGGVLSSEDPVGMHEGVEGHRTPIVPGRPIYQSGELDGYRYPNFSGPLVYQSGGGSSMNVTRREEGEETQEGTRMKCASRSEF